MSDAMMARSQTGGWRLVLLTVLLAGHAAAPFLPAAGAQFINYDDFFYVTNSRDVQAGISIENLKNIFLHRQMMLYHPLTTVSFVLDHELWGFNPAGYHIENIGLHVLGVVALFHGLSLATGSVARSLVATAIYAVHPLRVESIAWVAERKDVLCQLFGLLALLQYVRYCRRPGALKMVGLTALFALSILAKPMLVTLPFVFLLMDYWPLARFRFAPGSGDRFATVSFVRLIAEKLPLFLLAGLSVWTTLNDVIPDETSSTSVAQLPAPEGNVSAPAIDDAQRDPNQFEYSLFLDTTWRLKNVPVSYVRYLYQMVDFHRLSPFYPAVRWSWVQVVGASAILLALSVAALWQARRRPWFATGWLWFLGSLAPVIGIVLVSAYSLADRYTYFPMVGVIIAVIWSVPACDCSLHRIAWSTVAVVAIAILALASYVQSGYWSDSRTLWQHAIDVTENNWLAHDLLGSDLSTSTGPDLIHAVAELREAQKLEPTDDHPFFIAGRALLRLHRSDEAMVDFEKAVSINPRNALAAEELALILKDRGRWAESLKYAEMSLAIDPHYVKAKMTAAICLCELGRLSESELRCRYLLKVNQSFPEPYYLLGRIYMAREIPNDAIRYLNIGLSLHDNAEARKDLEKARQAAATQPSK